jgi:sulfotransferase family protein
LPVVLLDKVFGIARRGKRFLRNPKNALMRKLRDQDNGLKRRSDRSKEREIKQVRKEIKRKRREETKQLKNKSSKLENELKSKRREAKRIKKELLAAEVPPKKSEHRQRKKRAQQEIFQLERELGAAKGPLTVAGALPDFVVIGEKKCGTTYLYHLLTQHPLVEPAAKKELHFFDNHFDLGVEWYRRCFPQPRYKDGQRTITGEATPYMSHHRAPERMAEVVPQARLIALLRNPVDRTYSDYQQMVRKGRDTKTLEAAIGAAERKRSLRRGGAAAPEREDRADLNIGGRHWYLSRSVYVEQLLRWSEFFAKEQMLVLKSEDFFERPQQTLKVVLEFLGLPEWEPDASEIRKKGSYEHDMDPATRRRLEEYFEPHNKRLYDYLGVDFGW